MRRQGLKSWISISDFNTIGLFEVLIRIVKFLNILKKIERNIRFFKPDIIITIDSPSFNYRLIKNIQDLNKNTQVLPLCSTNCLGVERV